MNIILLIGTCVKNQNRIQNQIENLKLITPYFHPIFLFGRCKPPKLSHEIFVADVQEDYTHLSFKLLESFRYIYNTKQFDFICKIDDDTLLNFDRFDLSWVENKDYIGRFFDGKLSSQIHLDLDLYNIHETIQLSPSIFKDISFKRAGGNCYFLSKKAINYILNSPLPSDIGNNEDILMGYFLRNKNIIINDINHVDTFTEENNVQVTRNYFSIHPIHENLYQSLIGLDIPHQTSIISNNKILNNIKRDIYRNKLTNEIKITIKKFVNSPRSMGLG